MRSITSARRLACVAWLRGSIKNATQVLEGFRWGISLIKRECKTYIPKAVSNRVKYINFFIYKMINHYENKFVLMIWKSYQNIRQYFIG